MKKEVDFILFYSVAVIAFIFVYHKKARYYSAALIIGMGLGLLLAWAGFVIYLVNQNYYYNILVNMFFFGPSFWNWILQLKIPMVLAVRLINLGIVLFVYCFTMYIQQYTRLKVIGRKSLCIPSVPAAMFLFQLFFMNPLLYQWMAAHKMPQMEKMFYFVDVWGAPAFRLFNSLCVLGSIAMFFYDCIIRRSSGTAVKILVYRFLLLLSIGVMFLLTFSWAPTLLMRPTTIGNYFSYRVPDVEQMIPIVNFFPLFLSVFVCLLAWLSYRYRAVLLHTKNVSASFDRSMRIASQSMRVFTHAVKNQLVAIRSETEYLQEIVTENEEAAYSVNLIRQACENALHTIDSGSGTLRRRKLNMALTPLNVPVDHALAQLGGRAKNIRVEKYYPEKIPSILLDEKQMQEVVVNLLHNAEEAIYVSPRAQQGKITVTISSQRSQAILSIRDNGVGMDEATQQAVFDPFFSTKSSATNWGVGLSFCNSIITAHGGALLCSSQLDVGTKFDVVLPLI